MLKTTYTILLLISFTLLSTLPLESQVNIGLRAGLATTQLDPHELLIVDRDGLDKFKLRIKEINYGFHIGVMARFQINKFYIQPEVLYNSHSVEYEFEDLDNPELEGKVLSERFQHLDIPFMFGLKFAFFRINAGPVGHIQLSSVSELTETEGYRQKFEDLTLGWQAGIGFDIWNIHLDLRYEGNFSKYGDHIEFYGKEYNFSDTPNRMIASIGFVF